jgi:hypothetical protein
MFPNPMPLNHDAATATLTFAGLALFRLTGQEDTSQCEVSVLRCPNHKLEFRIDEIVLEDDGITPASSTVIAPQLDLEQDFELKVYDALNGGVPVYRNGGVQVYKGTSNEGAAVYNDALAIQPLNKLDPKADKEDFRWVVDFESADFHNGKIVLQPNLATTASPKEFKPKIHFSDGTLYTHAVTPDYFARELLTDRQDRRFIGPVAFRIGLDINCGEDGGIELSNPGGAKQLLPKRPDPRKPGVKYVISIENICPLTTEMTADGSDFRFYYDAITTADGKRYDLRRVVENGGQGNPDKRLKDQPNFSVDSIPHACNPSKG